VVRAGAGIGGSDRVELLWAAGAIQNTWLEVIVRGNDALGSSNLNSGLATSDVFFFASAPADSGAGDASGYAVNSADEQSARNDPHGLGNPATITNINDFNRDGSVNTTDQIAVRNFTTGGPNQVKFLNLSGGPFAPLAQPSVATAPDTAADSPEPEVAALDNYVTAAQGPMIAVHVTQAQIAPVVAANSSTFGTSRIDAVASSLTPSPQRPSAAPASDISFSLVAQPSHRTAGPAVFADQGFWLDEELIELVAGGRLRGRR